MRRHYTRLCPYINALNVIVRVIQLDLEIHVLWCERSSLENKEGLRGYELSDATIRLMGPSDIGERLC